MSARVRQGSGVWATRIPRNLLSQALSYRPCVVTSAVWTPVSSALRSVHRLLIRRLVPEKNSKTLLAPVLFLEVIAVAAHFDWCPISLGRKPLNLLAEPGYKATKFDRPAGTSSSRVHMIASEYPTSPEGEKTGLNEVGLTVINRASGLFGLGC